MIRKYSFGLFTFALGLVLGVFFKQLIFGLFGEIDNLFIGAILVGLVVVFYVVWRLTEKFGSGDKKKEQQPEEV